jgi:hypothetical protein
VGDWIEGHRSGPNHRLERLDDVQLFSNFPGDGHGSIFTIGAERQLEARIKGVCVHTRSNRNRREDLPADAIQHHHLLIVTAEEKAVMLRTMAMPLADSPGAIGQRVVTFELQKPISAPFYLPRVFTKSQAWVTPRLQAFSSSEPPFCSSLATPSPL